VGSTSNSNSQIPDGASKAKGGKIWMGYLYNWDFLGILLADAVDVLGICIDTV
jgi:hypothetical protein